VAIGNTVTSNARDWQCRGRKERFQNVISVRVPLLERVAIHLVGSLVPDVPLGATVIPISPREFCEPHSPITDER
jgi:hypothetical protein